MISSAAGEAHDGARSARFELFHRLGDAPCARIRKRVLELQLEPASEFRNVAFDSHRAAFDALGGGELPAIWDGAALHTGEAACDAFLSRLNVQRSERSPRA